MKEVLFRFIVGGLVVSAFSALGDVLKPKSFAGLFGAAPSVALATLSLTVATKGTAYAAVEARSMIGGSIALFTYTFLVTCVMFKFKPSTLLVTAGLLSTWLATALGVWFFFLK